MVSRKTIAIDVDDVTAAESESIRQFINMTYGLNLTPADYDVEGPYWGYWEHVWGVDKDTGKRWYEAYLESGAKATAQVVEGAIEAINALKENYELVIITSRHDTLIDITHEWLEKHFPKTFKGVHFTEVWESDEKVTKALICRKVGADYLVDDSADHCNLAAEEGIKALLFGDYGWNRKLPVVEGVKRVKNWQEVLEYFEHERSR